MVEYKIQICSAFGVRHDLYGGLSYQEALDICDEYRYEWVDENLFSWSMDIVEDDWDHELNYDEESFDFYGNVRSDFEEVLL